MGGHDKIPLICWDSCIFLAWFKKETDKDLDAIEHYLRQVSDGKLNLLVSAISYAEVLDNTSTKSTVGSQFRLFVKRPNVVMANVDERVGLLAAEIREATLLALAAGKISQGIKIPDALVAATAVRYKALEIHTYDPVLREISGWEVIEGRRVCTPEESLKTPLGF